MVWPTMDDFDKKHYNNAADNTNFGYFFSGFRRVDVIRYRMPMIRPCGLETNDADIHSASSRPIRSIVGCGASVGQDGALRFSGSENNPKLS